MPRVFQHYLTWLLATNHSPATVRNVRTALGRFTRWWHQTHPSLALAALRPRHLEAFQRALTTVRRLDGQPLGWGTQAEYLGALQGAFRWARARRLLPRDPAAPLTLPRRPVQLPRAVLTARESERVLHQARATTPRGLRDRALLELLYSSGLRRAEVAALRLGDLDPGRRLLMVRAGKGQRDRLVPLGRRAERWLRRYLRRARPGLVGTTAPDPGWLFVSARGRRLALNRLSERVAGYVRMSGVGKPGSCHLFRHTMATLLLEGGADVRVVQELLGHANLSTTARYTHVALGRLVRVHARAHPAERQQRGASTRRLHRVLVGAGVGPGRPLPAMRGNTRPQPQRGTCR
jgi:integrase/recombinase XerD